MLICFPEERCQRQKSPQKWAAFPWIFICLCVPKKLDNFFWQVSSLHEYTTSNTQFGGVAATNDIFSKLMKTCCSPTDFIWYLNRNADPIMRRVQQLSKRRKITPPIYRLNLSTISCRYKYQSHCLKNSKKGQIILTWQHLVLLSNL